MGMLDEIKAILSPAGAWLWAELGNMVDYQLMLLAYLSWLNAVVTQKLTVCTAIYSQY